METKALIVGCAGTELTAEERAFLKAEKPWGFILFARNIETPDQVRRLNDSFAECVSRKTVPILIDQEGGRVQRLRAPTWHDYPPAAALGALYLQDKAKGLRAAWLQSRLHSFDLLPLGFTVDCLPVLDVPAKDGHEVIGNRAYGDEPEIVSAMGQAACDGLKAGGVMPVIKHIPGHGRAKADSHKDLPVVDTPRETLEAVDFPPFAALSNEAMAMTAHVVFSALDAAAPATTSKTIIDGIIRGQMGFDGLLMSDDVSMEALSGDFATRTRAIFNAGCDMVLHCNGLMDQMKAVANETPQLSGKALSRADAAMAGIGTVDNADEAETRAEFADLLAQIPVA
ncbi:beta-N-acetylhexosaminidase [Pseudahrensia aquimaris]|uniref:beta-N-acetylhexosaminidase n=1 Tax=Pseudahrensia aquimaris TaxID=744461 RepID=A0ABW3FKW1_9HYPH